MENSDQPENPEEKRLLSRYGIHPKLSKQPEEPIKKLDLESQGIEVKDVSLEDLFNEFDEDKRRILEAKKRGLPKKEAILEMYSGSLETELAVIDLLKKTKEAIEKGEIPGEEIKEGDLVQAYVVRYYDGKVHTPEIEEGSSKYITYPFKVKSKLGCLIVEGSIAKRILFGPQKYLWDLLKEFPEEKRNEIVVTLQIRKIKSLADSKIKETIKKPPKKLSCEKSLEEQAADFKAFLKSGKDGNITETRVMTETETRPMPKLDYLPEAAETRQMSKQEQEELLKQKQRRISGKFKFR